MVKKFSIKPAFMSCKNSCNTYKNYRITGGKYKGFYGIVAEKFVRSRGKLRLYKRKSGEPYSVIFPLKVRNSKSWKKKFNKRSKKTRK